MLAFVHMLWEAQKKHPELEGALTSFAVLAAERTGYFGRCYLDGDVSFPLENATWDSWPQEQL